MTCVIGPTWYFSASIHVLVWGRAAGSVGVGPAATLLPYLLPIVLLAAPFVAGLHPPAHHGRVAGVRAVDRLVRPRLSRVSMAGHVHDASMRDGSIARVNARHPAGQQLIITDQTPEVVALELPAEPPIGSVVIDRDGMTWQSRTAWQARVLRGDGRVTWVSTGPRHLFAFGMRPEDGLTDWTLLVAERSPLTIVHVAEPTDVAVEDWDWGIHDAETYVPRGT